MTEGAVFWSALTLAVGLNAWWLLPGGEPPSQLGAMGWGLLLGNLLTSAETIAGRASAIVAIVALGAAYWSLL